MELEKYLGTWHQVAKHQPQDDDTRENVEIKYSKEKEFNVIIVTESADSMGESVSTTGRGPWTARPGSTRSDRFKLKYGYWDMPKDVDHVILKLWGDKDGNYMFSLVKDHVGMKLLSREKYPDKDAMGEVLVFLEEHYKEKFKLTLHKKEEKKACFNLEKYMGTWYQLAHYPSWYDRNENYNTTAEYFMMEDGTVGVSNSTMIEGKTITAKGTAKLLSDFQLKVDFSQSEVDHVDSLYGSGPARPILPQCGPNYIIYKLWEDDCGNYQYSLVSDQSKDVMYLLSRTTIPSAGAFGSIMKEVSQMFDTNRLVYTPHYQ
jgi:apolipoprotein D and lipocalin family protein